MATNTKSTRTKKASTAAHVETVAEARPRRLRLPVYKLFRLKRVTYPERLPSVWKLSRQTAALLWQYRWLFLGIALIYGVLNIIFVRGLSGGLDVESLKKTLGTSLGGSDKLVTGLTVFVTLMASSGNDSNATAGAYQLFLGLLISLVTIWAVRQATAGHAVRIRDAFYSSAYPLVPFVLVLFVVLLQLIPMIIGLSLFSVVMSTGIAATGIEQLLWGAVCLTLAVISIYMLCSSLFALYIVTLPDMTPLKALRTARQLVQYRRGQVLPKLLFLPVALLAIAAIIMVPAIVFVAPVAQWLLFVLSMFSLVVIHAYMYTVYKALLA